MSRLVSRVLRCLLTFLLCACGASTGIDDGEGGTDAAVGPGAGPSIACVSTTCAPGVEACELCGRPEPEVFSCRPLGASPPVEDCADDPFSVVVAECDGPEDCGESDCEAFGAAIGHTFLRCGRGPGDGDGICHTDADCAPPLRCGEGIGPYSHCR